MMRSTIRHKSGGCGIPRGQAAPAFVALVIVAACAGLLSPVFSSRPHDPARERSMRNLRALAHATRMYADDWEGVLPGWQRNPDGTYSHNVWDQQIFPYVRRNDAYFNGRPRGFRSSADPLRQRVLSYGLNGYLIATPTTSFNGSVRLALTFSGSNPPRPMRLGSVTRPADTILFAEVATLSAVQNFTVARWADVADPAPNGSDAWNAALVHWIDISPREWVETPLVAGSPVGSSAYVKSAWDTSRGIARALYGGGGNYAFVDGHVEFQTLGETVGLGKTYTLPDGSQSPAIAPGNDGAWKPLNTHNQWNPQR